MVMPFASALPVSANAGMGWAATRRQVIVLAVEHARCAAPMQGITPRTLELALFYFAVEIMP
jgi:hypothetical protein